MHVNDCFSVCCSSSGRTFCCCLTCVLYEIVLKCDVGVCRRLGQLITMAGIDQSSMPFSRPSTNGVNGTSNGAVTSSSPPNLARPSTEVGDGRSNMQAVPSKSDSQLQTKPNKIAFPQITPQNYVNSGDPTMQPAAATGAGDRQSRTSPNKSKSKFDEMYQRVIADTEGALQKSLTETDMRKPEVSGLYTQGAAGSGIPLDRDVRSGASASDDKSQRPSKGSSGGGGGGDHQHSSSHRPAPLSIMELHSVDELPTTTDNVKPTSTASSRANKDTAAMTSSRYKDVSSKSAKYSDTFEKSDDESDDEIEEDIDDVSEF